MATRQLIFAGGAYDRTQALIDGTVTPEGLELNWLTLPYLEIWKRMLNYYDFDASELSFSSYLIGRSLGKPLIAIPVFPARAFRHSYVFINKKSGIEKPKDLVGKKIGVADFLQTATVWMRGILHHEYDVDLDQIQWLIWEKETRVAINFPKRYSIQHVPAGKKPDEMLLRGELDAIIHANLFPSLLHADHIQRLFKNYKEVEIDYYKKTGIFPIMHTVVIKEDLWKDCSWIAISLYKAFQAAKELAYQRLNDVNAYKISMVWFRTPMDEQRNIFGEDPWPYGAENNRRAIETLILYLHEQGLIAKKLNMEEIFAANTLDL